MDSAFEHDADMLRDAFLEAPFEREGWDDALRMLATCTRSTRAQLIGVGSTVTMFNRVPDVDPSYQQEFVEIEAYRPEVNWRIAATGAPLEVIHEAHYDQAKAHSGNADYADHAWRWGAVNGCQTALIQGSDLLVGLAALRSERDGRTDRRARRLFAASARAALAAVRMQKAIAHRGAALLVGAMDAIAMPVLLLDYAGTVLALSPSADTLLSGAAGAPLRVVNGRLHAAQGDADRTLQAAIGAVCGDGPEAIARQLWLEAPGGGEGLFCELFRLPVAAFDLRDQPRVLVSLRSGADIPAARLAPLRAALGLTPAEAEIALSLANGASRVEIASERSVSPHTLATQIKSILAKIDADREAALVAMVNRLLR